MVYMVQYDIRILLRYTVYHNVGICQGGGAFLSSDGAFVTVHLIRTNHKFVRVWLQVLATDFPRFSSVHSPCLLLSRCADREALLHTSPFPTDLLQKADKEI
jgi:hypothetical protein